jgi:GNAT superfamily N-acetyltransferase
MNDFVVPHPKLHIVFHRCGVEDTEAISNWCDVFMAGDYFVRKGHMLNLVRNPVIRVGAIIIDGCISGFVAVYKDTTLQNLLIDPQYRGMGVGSALVAVLKPTVIRCKTNMVAGDPTGFYESNGYVSVAQDPARPHITVMTNDPAKVPALTLEAEKQARNKARMNALRAIQKEKRIKAQADAVQELLAQRGIVMPAAQTIAPPPAPAPAAAQGEGAGAKPPAPVAVSPAPETFVHAGGPAGLWE